MGLDVTKKEIDEYLAEVKKAVTDGRYRIELNSNRQDNMDLFINYVINEADAHRILCELETEDFSEVVPNIHKGYEHELLYVFGKELILLERTGNSQKKITLYIKINKVDDGFVFVVSFHESKHPIVYYFK